MSRTDQGVFKKLSIDFASLETEYNQAIKCYFGNGEWDYNYDFFTDFAYTADSIYLDANNLVSDINGMLNATKFKLADNEKKYRNMLLLAQEIGYEIKNRFDSVFDMIRKSSGYISDVEQSTLDKLSISY